ncbi:hypothetical protein Hthe01_07540 [Hydrogenophilus thermoluteolus]|uniref:DNA methyltransferase n=1 Tax=Hydrogenophilus thermoluteolus TaxID=297 RepID=UPI0024A5A982|nr:site-specific DNA-methyltransferase [Hydrogenophilus thermoluteolus]GLW60405.1 hypothetical protein Hthe01_07540 [Hydrogenophilus thermoluteolus]
MSHDNHTKKFQGLLRQLFEFECADLDFGVYRIMNHKRQVIERWITEDLPKAIKEELNRGTLAEQQQARQALEEARRKVIETLGEEALDAEGNLAEQYRNTKVGQEYLEAFAKATHAQPAEALEAQVYNHLYTFFSRYYQDGDFISKRRYSKKERYAIPYNGEEVYLYWANHDQYYVKTAEHFTDYTWKAPNGVTVHLKLQAADVEVNNIKGEKRFFLPVLDGITWDAEARTLTIPFQYRPLTEQEKITYAEKQEKILEKALEAIPAQLKGNAEALAALTAERRRDAQGNSVSCLEHHLRQYTARNTRDFFIHKDLKGFLSRELDFYLKNEVLNLDELEAAGEDLAEGWCQLMRLIKRIGGHIIDFLAQIEDFQKALWEKKKFITETFWCITVGHIPEGFYPEIAANEAQWEEWRDLFHIHELPKDEWSDDLDTEEGRIAFLKAHPTLVLDTRHFSQDFTDRLLASFEDLDEMTDGLLVHSENWQALNLLLEKYRERVRCTYIDPPFNTDDSQFAFKDNYRNSTWLSLMNDRLRMGAPFLTSDGSIYVHLDHNSNFYGRFLLDSIFGSECLLNEVIWRIGWVSGYKTAADRYVRNHETIFVYGRQSQPYFNKNKARIPYTSFSEDTIRSEVESIKRTWGLSGLSPLRLKLTFIDAEGRVYKIGLTEKEGAYNVEDTWNCNEYEELHSNKIKRNVAEYTPHGSEITQKPEQLLRRVIEVSSEKGGIILDFFAGSGTTPAVAKKLGRRFVAVEMGSYFDTDMLWRMKKVLFGTQVGISKQCGYKGGGIVKVIRLESYEDALNNITFDEESGQKALDLFGDEYLLRYMLKWESKKSETFLDVEKLQAPFSYKLRIHRSGETREQPVDLPETFAYLIGLDVEKRQVLHDGGRRYLVHRGTTRDGRRVAVIWRETQGWTQADYERDARFVAEQGLTKGADEVFVNGDSYIEGARSLDGLFKARLFGQEG